MLLVLDVNLPRCNYQALLPWQELEQERLVEFQPVVVTRFLTPLL